MRNAQAGGARKAQSVSKFWETKMQTIGPRVEVPEIFSPDERTFRDDQLYFPLNQLCSYIVPVNLGLKHFSGTF